MPRRRPVSSTPPRAAARPLPGAGDRRAPPPPQLATPCRRRPSAEAPPAPPAPAPSDRPPRCSPRGTPPSSPRPAGELRGGAEVERDADGPRAAAGVAEDGAEQAPGKVRGGGGSEFDLLYGARGVFRRLSKLSAPRLMVSWRWTCRPPTNADERNKVCNWCATSSLPDEGRRRTGNAPRLLSSRSLVGARERRPCEPLRRLPQHVRFALRLGAYRSVRPLLAS